MQNVKLPSGFIKRHTMKTYDELFLTVAWLEKQGGMAFGFRKTATAVIKPDRQTDKQTDRQTDRQTGR
jgi:hypothetical protein